MQHVICYCYQHCDDHHQQVKVQTWVNGVEDAEFVGVGARFGRTIVSKEKNARQTRLVLSDPRDCCSPPMNKVLSFFMYESVILWCSLILSRDMVEYLMLLVQLCHIMKLLDCWRCHHGGSRQLHIHKKGKFCTKC